MMLVVCQLKRSNCAEKGKGSKHKYQLLKKAGIYVYDVKCLLTKLYRAPLERLL